MKTPEEKRWDRLQELLFAESRGDAPVRISSTRTLFGIKSHVEEVIEAVAAEDREKCEQRMRQSVQEGKPMNETVTNLTSRKSATSFKPEHISREDIDMIVQAGLNAPSGMNTQSPIFIVVTNDDMVKKLSQLNAKFFAEMMKNLGMTAPEGMSAPMDPFYGAKDVIAVVALKAAPTHVNDGSLAIGNMLNAAWSMGIDSRWIHRAKEVFDSDEGKEILAECGITEPVEGIGFCILGHHDEEKEKTEIREGRVYYID
ncbi:MAG: nitroreductase family protein [Eggerthellaceae bacterium]|nr:nitroreductase family protein [Eggerthellaceae bacterium]